MASLEVDLSGIEEGQTVTVKWRGKPVFIRHRTSEEIQEAEGTDITGFRDPQTDAERVVDPKVGALSTGPDITAGASAVIVFYILLLTLSTVDSSNSACKVCTGLGTG